MAVIAVVTAKSFARAMVLLTKFTPKRDKDEITRKECGNGKVVARADGLSSQYCHLKKGSLPIQPGALVRKGRVLGAVGSSELAQFPDLQFAVRPDGKLVDPLSGRSLQDRPPFAERVGST